MKMDEKFKYKLEENGWKIGDTKDFLNLTEEEIFYVEKRIEVARIVKELDSNEILEKWRATGLLKGVSGWKEVCVAHILEKQEKFYVK